MDMNPFELLKNAKMLQEKMGSFQAQLEAMTVTGSAGGGLVEIDLNGKMEVRAVRIAPEAVDPAEIGLLQDMVQAAFIDAGTKVRESMQQQLGPLAGGLGL